jgi:type VI secretion system protein ImpJ
MEPFHKIVWAEGLFLGQQHFQQWDQYHETDAGADAA